MAWSFVNTPLPWSVILDLYDELYDVFALKLATTISSYCFAHCSASLAADRLIPFASPILAMAKSVSYATPWIPTPSLLADTMPATCVPCPFSSSYAVS